VIFVFFVEKNLWALGPITTAPHLQFDEFTPRDMKIMESFNPG
jgi:hypothetical protein